ncbi:MAG: hypothetical protein ACRDJE_19620 [Dehalococcoidia bacterium]
MTTIPARTRLTLEQHRKLQKPAAQWGCSQAEVLRVALDRLPVYDDSVYHRPATQRLAMAGLLVPPPDDDDLPPPEEVDELEREWSEWLRGRGQPLGLTETLFEDRR